MRKCDFCKHNGICSFNDITNCAIRDYIHFEMEESIRDVDSRNHRRWEAHFVCSKCGETVRTVLAECPCCHARMDGLDI